MNIGSQKNITVVLADDHRYTRTIIRNYINRSPDIQVIGEANDGIEAITLVSLLNPDVLILDMEMVGLGGIDVLRQLRRDQRKMSIIAFSAYNDSQYIKSVLDLGADRYLIKDVTFANLLDTIRQVAKTRGVEVHSIQSHSANAEPSH